jgi:hypothetical protein
VDANGLPVQLGLVPREAPDNRLCSVLLTGLLDTRHELATGRLNLKSEQAVSIVTVSLTFTKSQTPLLPPIDEVGHY